MPEPHENDRARHNAAVVQLWEWACANDEDWFGYTRPLYVDFVEVCARGIEQHGPLNLDAAVQEYTRGPASVRKMEDRALAMAIGGQDGLAYFYRALLEYARGGEPDSSSGRATPGATPIAAELPPAHQQEAPVDE